MDLFDRQTCGAPNHPATTALGDLRVRESLANLLVSFGYVADSYESAEQFLESDRPLRVCCIVTDLQMRQMSGFGPLTKREKIEANSENERENVHDWYQS
jgi:hypothetical protein